LGSEMDNGGEHPNRCKVHRELPQHRRKGRRRKRRQPSGESVPPTHGPHFTTLRRTQARPKPPHTRRILSGHVFRLVCDPALGSSVNKYLHPPLHGYGEKMTKQTNSSEILE